MSIGFVVVHWNIKLRGLRAALNGNFFSFSLLLRDHCGVFQFPPLGFYFGTKQAGTPLYQGS